MIMKTLSKELRRILRENNKMAVIYTGTKLGSKILFQEVTIMIWVNVLKNGLSKICGRKPLKKFEGVWSALTRPYSFKYFKGCLPQILLGFLNTLSQKIYHTVFPENNSNENYIGEWARRLEEMVERQKLIYVKTSVI